jgi:hypothetical protein
LGPFILLGLKHWQVPLVTRVTRGSTTVKHTAHV